MWPAQDGTNVIASKILGGIADLAGIRNLKSKVGQSPCFAKAELWK